MMPRHGAVEVQLTGAPHCTKLYGYGIPVSLLLIAQRGDATSVGGKRGYHLRGVLSTSSAGGALDFFFEDLSLGGSVKGGCSRTAGYKSLQNHFPIQTVPVSCSILATSDSFRRMIWTRIDHLDLRSSAALAPLPLSPSSFLKTMRNKSERLPMITRRRKKKKKRNKKKGYKKKKHPSLCNGLSEQPGKNMSGR